MKLILGAGALAGALAAILGLTGTIQSWFKSVEGTISTLEVKGVEPMTSDDWAHHEGATAPLPRPQRGLRGAMVSYDVETTGWKPNTLLPVRLTLYDETSASNKTIVGESIRVRDGPDCGCADWLQTTKRGHHYKIEIRIYRPGPITASPARVVLTDPFTAK
jgi:hypothetical protein